MATPGIDTTNSDSSVPEGWTDVEGMSKAETVPPGADLFKQGDRVEYVYFLEKGLVKTLHTDSNGEELIISLMYSEGSIMGASCAVLGKHNVTATALSKSTYRRLPADRFRDLLRKDSDMSWKIHQLHCRVLSEQITQRIQLGCQTAKQRLEQLLWQLIVALDVKIDADGARIPLPLKYWEIAQLIVVTPEHLCRMVKRMEDDGLLKREKGWMQVPRPQDLWRSS